MKTIAELEHRVSELEAFISGVYVNHTHLLEAPEHKKHYSCYQGIMTFIPVTEVQRAMDLLNITIKRREE